MDNVLPKYHNSADSISPFRVHFVQITYLQNEIGGKKESWKLGSPTVTLESRTVL
jgi:hypothetical protein